jgi:thiol-disulfide isomerase/thioredoxin
MKNFENIIKKVFIIVIFNVFTSCDQKEILIKGNVTNLPDGVMYLCKDNNLNKIDSVETINGKFTLKHSLENEPIYIALHHIDKNNIFRMISFPTNAKYNNCVYNSSLFMSDSIVLINGLFTDDKPLGIFIGNTKFVSTKKIIAGYQTNALFHTDGDLFDKINIATFGKVLSKIKEYPNSFHLLYQINNNRNSFTPSQTQSLINSFKGEITDSNTFKNFKDYNKKRGNKKKLTIPHLLDNKGKKTEVLDTKFKKHLVVFWASWCGPCRQEIPSLKKMYPKYKNTIEFVSISIDEKNSLWQKALDKEQMSWKQLIVNEESKEFEPIEIFFQLSPSIPYISLVNDNMKVVKSHVGLITEMELEKLLKE